MKKILIVDDDSDNLGLVAEMLNGSFETLTATNPREGIQIAVQQQPAAIVLDVNMPGMDGFEVCRKLRDQPSTRQIPVIMLTSNTGIESRVKGLDTGADDYITKPFHGRELIARINARLRRQAEELRLETTVTIGNLKLDPRSTQVWIDGAEIRLTQLEFDLLRYFLEHPNEIIDRNRILGDLWPDAVVTDRTVDTHMANLRKKIKGFTYPLQTIYGAGYLLKIPNPS